MYTYILKSYFPICHISRFASPLISYVGQGSHSTISSYEEGAINFRTAKFWERTFD